MDRERRVGGVECPFRRVEQATGTSLKDGNRAMREIRVNLTGPDGRTIKASKGDKASVVKMVPCVRCNVNRGQTLEYRPETSEEYAVRIKAYAKKNGKAFAVALDAFNFIWERFKGRTHLSTYHDDKDWDGNEEGGYRRKRHLSPELKTFKEPRKDHQWKENRL